MGDKMFSDPMDELFASRREAYDTGKYRGAAEMISWARQELSKLSVKYEPYDDPSKFHAVEECCAILRKLAEITEADRQRSQTGEH